MTKKEQLKSEVNHTVNSKTTPMMSIGGLFRYRYIDVEDLFDCIVIDDKPYYNFKLIDPKTTWYHHKVLDKVYKYNSIYMNFSFRNEDLPKRCKAYHESLTEDVYTYLKDCGERVSKSKLRLVVKHLIKHVSRLKFHKKYAIRYTRNPKHWKTYGKNLSWTYMNKLIDYLISKDKVNSFTGGVKRGKEDVCSLLVINPEFVDLCTGKITDEVTMDDCLLPPNKPLVEIRDEDKNPRKPTREERIQVSDMTMVVEEYCKLLSQKTISINGISVPELFFRRIATIDLNHGCRWFDDGTIQGEDETSRSSILIDTERTVEVDYSSLHYSLAAEELGVDLKGKDPYNFPFEVSVDTDAISEWKDTYGFKGNYDPVRNLKKTALLTMFNAKSERSAVSAISKAIKDDYRKEEPVKRKFVGISDVSVKDLVTKLVQNNREVSQYLLSGVGLRFQKLDSEMMTYCIKKFMEENEVCIPIHDSLVVKESMKDFAISCMKEAYIHVMGSGINCKVK